MQTERSVFETRGPVSKDRNYVVPRTAEVADLVERIKKGRYVVIFAPRQTGKTTFFRWALDALTAEDPTYFPIQLDFETFSNASVEAQKIIGNNEAEAMVANGLVHAILHLVKNSAGLLGSGIWGLSFSVGGHFASYLLPIIPIGIALSFVALSQKQRLLFLLVGVIISAALFFSLLAGTMLSFILSLNIYCLVIWRN